MTDLSAALDRRGFVVVPGPVPFEGMAFLQAAYDVCGVRRHRGGLALDWWHDPRLLTGMSSSPVLLALRSLLWTILLPGAVAGYVPWSVFGLDRTPVDVSDPVSDVGVVCIALGVALLVACIFEFARSGRGTLSPLDPPRHLVVRGLYRYVRNPMYLSVTMIVLGETLVARSLSLFVYWACWFALVNVFVVAYEEPALRRQFGESYEAYARQVGRWIPRRHPGVA